MLVEGPCIGILGVHDQCVGGDFFSDAQASIDSTTQYLFPEPPALNVLLNRKPTHPKTRDGVARQAPPFFLGYLCGIDLSRAQRVIAEHLARRISVNQDVDLSKVSPAILRCASPQIVIEFRCSAVECGTIVDLGIKPLFLKHGARSGERCLVPPAGLRWG